MAAIEFTGKEIYSRVLQAVPDASENYILNLINEALIDMGQFLQKVSSACHDKIRFRVYISYGQLFCTVVFHPFLKHRGQILLHNSSQIPLLQDIVFYLEIENKIFLGMKQMVLQPNQNVVFNCLPSRASIKSI